ncbi:MAG: glycosyltransferase family 2 protein [Agarilytica sp.]
MSLETPKVALVAFVYPVAEPYYRETLASMQAQSYIDMDLIVINDGLDCVDVPESMELRFNDGCLGLVPLREQVFNSLIDEGYDLVIHIDPDDTMSEDRVEGVVNAWNKQPKAGFYYSSLHYMSQPELPFFSELPEDIKAIDEVLASNCIGLSHFSFNAKLLRELNFRFAFPAELIALDWYMASVMLEEGMFGVKDAGRVYYRIYEDNTAGELKELSIEKYTRAVDVKLQHYLALRALSLSDEHNAFALGETERLIEIKEKIDTEQDIGLVAVNSKLSQNTKNYWWANI